MWYSFFRIRTLSQPRTGKSSQLIFKVVNQILILDK
jgi:hypothetical protein